MDGIILSDTVNRQTFQSRSASDLLGITDFILWRNTYQIAVELYDIVTTSDSFDYNFAIPLYSNLRIGDRVIFNNSGAIGRGRIVAISESQYTIDPFITYPNLYQNKSSSKYSNFIIMDKIQVALIPANYR